MSADLIECIAAETANMNNRRAWLDIFDRLIAAGVARRDASAQRGAVWAVRKQNASARRQAKQAARLGENTDRLRMNPT